MGLEREREGGIIVKARIRFGDLLVIEKVGFEVRDHGTILLPEKFFNTCPHIHPTGLIGMLSS